MPDWDQQQEAKARQTGWERAELTCHLLHTVLQIKLLQQELTTKALIFCKICHLFSPFSSIPSLCPKRTGDLLPVVCHAELGGSTRVVLAGWCARGSQGARMVPCGTKISMNIRTIHKWCLSSCVHATFMVKVPGSPSRLLGVTVFVWLLWSFFPWFAKIRQYFFDESQVATRFVRSWSHSFAVGLCSFGFKPNASLCAALGDDLSNSRSDRFWDVWHVRIWGVHGPPSDSPSNGCRKVHSQSRITSEFATCAILWSGSPCMEILSEAQAASLKNDFSPWFMMIYIVFSFFDAMMNICDQRYPWFDWVLSSCSAHPSSWNPNLRR